MAKPELVLKVDLKNTEKYKIAVGALIEISKGHAMGMACLVPTAIAKKALKEINTEPISGS